MQIVYLSHPIEQAFTNEQVMAIGFFDGIHLGHQELLHHAKQVAEEKKILFTAMTFSPHPDEIIKGDKNRKYLTPLPQKIKKMAEYGVEKLYVVTFDKRFASLPPIEFINHYIIGTHSKHVVVGFDFTFGFKARGDTQFLRDKSQSCGYELSVIDKKTYMGEKISSTLLRELLMEGKVASIPHYLGENYCVNANVTRENGDFVTVAASERYLLPSHGEYYVNIIVGESVYNGVFYRNKLTENECLVNDSGIKQGTELTIEFLEKVHVESMVSS
ncbi:hypothetical protein GCM10008983_16790 [Lentibacillus halophilus]|uniref:Riboflavin biosynthesis protein n=1 Tax=Lentibacillus halophilus TaxID=295065 RepID=A0ABN0ZA59_9BACI